MREGWEKMRLMDVCEKITDGTHQTPTYYDEGFIFLSSGNVTSGKINWDKIKYIDSKQHVEMQKRVSPKMNDILLAKNGTTGVAAMVDRDIPFDIYVSLALLRPLKKITPNYLLYFINSPIAKKQFNKRLKGIGVPNLHLEEIREVLISYPQSMETQKEIVAILDEAFTTIDQAKENLQRNLQNAKELFQSELNRIFTTNGDGWIEKKLNDVAKINYGYTEKASFENVGPKFLRITDIQNDGVDWETVPFCKCNSKDLPKYQLEKGDIVFARTGATTGKSYLLVNPPISVFASYLIRLKLLASSGLLPEFVYYFFKTRIYWDEINAGVSGSAQGGFNATKLGELGFSFPINKEVQKEIISQLDILSIQTKQLEEKYQQKLNSLEELKKSILEKAFSGELTKPLAVAQEINEPVAIPLKKIGGISATDLHVGLIALALQKHENARKQNTFGHVKSEKIINLISYHVCIDLERKPIKDAAGPNDFPRIKNKVEPRAKKWGVFDVHKIDDHSYTYTKGNKFEFAASKAMMSIGNDWDKAEYIIDLLVPMSTQQAEIVATVYSAWNNLILEGKEITDEAIVTEARENWHEAKLKIEREKFFKAITWMKGKGLVPCGSGQIIAAKK